MERFLLCRPQGGLNDMLCRIKLCYDYACKFNRTLIIDTLTRTYLSTNFGKIFEFNDPRVITEVNSTLLKTLTELDNLSYYFERKNISSNYFNQPVDKLNFYTNSNIDWHGIYKFDLSKEYEQTVLYYQRYGGGQDSYKLLKKNISLINKKFVRYVLSLLPSEEYESIHIRHTDFRAENYLEFLEQLKPKINNKKILICTDNNQVKENCIDFLGTGVAFSITNIPKSSLLNEPLHIIPSIKTFKDEPDLFLELKNKLYPFNSDEFNIQTVNSIIDLLGLIFSSKVHFPQITSKQREDEIVCRYKKQQNKISGYAKLALNIQKDKKLVARLKQC